MASLTRTVQQHLSGFINEGERAIDATAGNGHDTLFLAQMVDKSGCVFAFDIQQLAIENTLARLQQFQADSQVKLILDSHANMRQHIPLDFDSSVKCIMFNLGYLPGADKNCITRADSTINALQTSLSLLHADGILSVMLYPGHKGGDTEAAAVMQWAEQLPPIWSLQKMETPGPVWLGITRTTQAQ